MPSKVRRKLQKYGDSRFLAMPPHWIAMFGIKTGDVVQLFYDSVVIIVPEGFEIDRELLKREIDAIANASAYSVKDDAGASMEVPQG